jgi:FkbM family methyltransferase
MHHGAALTLYYSNQKGDLEKVKSFNASPYDLSSNNFHYILGDFNGDNKTDLVHVGASEYHSSYFFSSLESEFEIKRPYPEPSTSRYGVRDGYFLSGRFESASYDSTIHIFANKIHAWKHMSEGRVHIVPEYTMEEDITWYPSFINDADSDGLDDIIFLDTNSNLVHILYSEMCPPNSMRTFASYHNLNYNSIIEHRHENMFNMIGQEFQMQEMEKIPYLAHYIWVNNDNKKTYLNEDAEKILNYNFNMLSSSLWSHYLWINKSSFNHAKTIKMFESLGGKIKFIEDLPSYYLVSQVIESAISLNSFGQASDYLRFTILKDFGGLYLDIDYQLKQDVSILNNILDFYASTESWKADFLSTSMIAAKTGHPIIDGAIKYSTELMDDYNCEYDPKDTSILTGPGSISLAYFKYSNIEDSRDVAFTSEIGQNAKNLNVFEKSNLANIQFKVNGQNFILKPFGYHWGMNTWSDVLDDIEQEKDENLETAYEYQDDYLEQVIEEMAYLTGLGITVLKGTDTEAVKKIGVEHKKEDDRNDLIAHTSSCTRMSIPVLQLMDTETVKELALKCSSIKEASYDAVKNISFVKFSKLPVLSLLADNRNVIFTNAADKFGQALANDRGHEFDTLEQLLENIKEGDTYVEVGANYGDFLVAISEKIGKTGKAYGFEPSPTVFPFLAASIAANGRDNVVLEEKAASVADGELVFIVRDEIDAGGSLGSTVEPTINAGHFNDVKDNTGLNSLEVRVPAVSLDTYFAENDIIPNLVRLDAEGSECQVIKGMKNTLKSNINLSLSVEIQPPLLEHFETPESLDECYSLLYDNGFYVSHIGQTEYLSKDNLLNTEGAEILAVKSMAVHDEL